MDTANEASVLCRLCANHDDQMMPIFNGDGLEHNIATKMECYLPITLLENDKLPMFVCYQCASTVISWHNLYEGFLLADTKLKELINDDKDMNTPKSENHNKRRISDEICIVTYESEPEDDNTEIIEVNESGLLSESEDSKEVSDPLLNERAHIFLEETTKFTYDCNECGIYFETRSNLIKHLRSHKNKISVKKYVCTKCEKMFGCHSTLNDHLRKEHSLITLDKNKKGFICSACGKSLSRKASLKIHLARHEQKDPIKCLQCDYRCYSESELKSHIKKHELPYSCKICLKKFSQKFLVKRHEESVHLNLRPFNCEYCDKKFKTKSNLGSHVATHRNIRNFPCTICNLKCKSNNALTVHLRTHTKEKPYYCSFCGLSYNLKTDCINHEKRHMKKNEKALMNTEEFILKIGDYIDFGNAQYVENVTEILENPLTFTEVNIS